MPAPDYNKQTTKPKESLLSKIKKYFFEEPKKQFEGTPLHMWQRFIETNPEYFTPERDLYILGAASPSPVKDKIILYDKIINHVALKYETINDQTKDNIASYLANGVDEIQAENLVNKIRELEENKNYKGINSILTRELEKYEVMLNEGFLNQNTNYKNQQPIKQTDDKIQEHYHLKGNIFNVKPEILLSGEYT